ncbi:MAG TPA: zf-HC2 domain-containing protein [Actinomycetota bacterium]|nr:zf-HC2 domain-containing protein [Actinomycetota bacterium]
MLKQIELYLDGELVESLRVEVERHLGGCGACSGHAEFQQRLKDAIRSKCGCHEIPPELIERLRASVEHPHGHPS